MTCLTIAVLVVLVLLGLGSVVKAGQFASFVINVEEITNTNKECKQTVIEQKNMMANLTSSMEDQGATIENLKATIEELNTTVKDQAEAIEDQAATIDVLVTSNIDLNSTLTKIKDGKQLNLFSCRK